MPFVQVLASELQNACLPGYGAVACLNMAAVNNAAPDQYARHRPQQGLFYRIIETYWPIFVREQGRVGKTLPIFIRDEFEKFLKCGIPEHGFIRTYCYQCQYSGIVAFSCKKRGFCPSCTARRMNDEAAHLVDHVLPPEVPMRQWVLSFPYKLRFLMAHNSKLTNRILSVYIKAIGSSLKKRAKKSGIKGGKPGSVTFIQRFGSALNLNVHFHTLFADGVFYKKDDGYYFFRLPPPSQEELYFLAAKIKTKVLKVIDELGLNDQDQMGFDEDALSPIAAMSISHKAAFGERGGGNLKRYGIKKIEVDPEGNDPFSVNVDGFSLNARVGIWGKEKEKLEKLIRYMARGPVATERLTECFPNTLLYRMKTPWKDGTTHVSFSYLDFIARLVALIPPPKMNMVRYHGVFAPNFKDRGLVVPEPKADPAESAAATVACDTPCTAQVRRERMRWSEMLKRTFEIDVTVCPDCNGRLEQIAVIKDKAVAAAILKSLDEVSIFRPLEIVRERGPPGDGGDFPDEFDQRASW
jgi:hypothetical protein